MKLTDWCYGVRRAAAAVIKKSIHPCCIYFKKLALDCQPRGVAIELEPKRRVVCAALRAVDGALLLGIRHYSIDMHRQMEQHKNGKKFRDCLDENQGFVDQFGVYMSRVEAYQVAEAAGQLRYPTVCGEGQSGPRLYSEGLY